MLSNEEKIELLSQKISFLRAALASEIKDLDELKKIDHFKVSQVEADLLDRQASITALDQELVDLRETL
jgi:hypothetical protein